MANNHKPQSPTVRYGLDNPHPLSQLKTELVWDGKYDEYGNRRVVDIAGCAMPLQKIETIDEPRSRAAAVGNLELFEKQLAGKKRDDFRNRLIWGDNKLVMASLLAEFKGKIDLFYIDPPFDVGADFTMDVPIGDEREMVEKDQSTLEMVAYRDMWGKCFANLVTNSFCAGAAPKMNAFTPRGPASSIKWPSMRYFHFLPSSLHVIQTPMRCSSAVLPLNTIWHSSRFSSYVISSKASFAWRAFTTALVFVYLRNLVATCFETAAIAARDGTCASSSSNRVRS
jgi:adenine-specific DNA-methyltransferase